MKRHLLTIALFAVPAFSWAECQIFSSQQKVTWGRLSAAERQHANGEAISLPEKQIQVQVVCSEPQRIRLFVGSDRPQNGTFSLGPDGEMRIVASRARVDDKPVRLRAVNASEAIPVPGGSETLDITLNQGMAFIDGNEAYGKTATVLFNVMPTIKPGAITERVTWRGNLRIKMDVQ
ncbi:hypothetical protein NB069_19640 [Leclercia adecarboxylata]|uniref:hypothetical protein n=1 Tax=Leclercia adecarboxylata TaxID=83655 RepID=UPI002029E23F|nr:hypothetical protein [Leclercia adecarboxylata]URN98846.1 hypothetical protein NB069_19640 [Leclercia adecarboxylata]